VLFSLRLPPFPRPNLQFNPGRSFFLLASSFTLSSRRSSKFPLSLRHLPSPNSLCSRNFISNPQTPSRPCFGLGPCVFCRARPILVIGKKSLVLSPSGRSSTPHMMPFCSLFSCRSSTHSDPPSCDERSLWYLFFPPFLFSCAVSRAFTTRPSCLASPCLSLGDLKFFLPLAQLSALFFSRECLGRCNFFKLRCSNAPGAC